MKCNQRGFTLIEMLITMAIFVTIIMITSSAFKMIVTQTKKLMYGQESNIEGVIGLETFRHDLQQGGFGLPYTFPSPAPQYLEAANAPSNSYNDAPSGVPRAFVSGNNLAGVSESSSGVTYNVIDGSDYLAIKGTSVGRSNTSQRWTYMQYSSLKPHTWPSAAENIKNSAWIIVLKRTFSNRQASNQLVVDGTQVVTSNLYFSPNYSPSGFAAPAFNPQSPSDIYFLYGIDDDDIRMPFNRTDYFLGVPQAAGRMSSICSPHTGILYKTTVNQKDGKLNYIPLMDCVADMQVVFGWDVRAGALPGTDGLVDTYSNADGTAIISTSLAGSGTLGVGPTFDFPAAVSNAETIRNSLKVVKIYVLAQNGRMDPTYNSPGTFRLFGEGESSLGRTYTLTPDMRNYRWKVYQIVATPKNLTSNQ
jgi:prepilin-type N-terminal cleavage/methylation domain-containing protein